MLTDNIIWNISRKAIVSTGITWKKDKLKIEKYIKEFVNQRFQFKITGFRPKYITEKYMRLAL